MKRAMILGVALMTLAVGMYAIAKAVNRTARQVTPVVTQTIGTAEDESFTPGPAWLTEYTLTERSGRQFNSTELKGTVHIVNFFFASCPTQCPLQTAKVAQLEKQYGEQGVRFLSITCDPDTDTVEKLRAFASQQKADPQRWLFLTGDMTYLRRVGAEVYSVAVTERGHRNELIVVDKWGQPRGYFDWNDPTKMGELRSLLDELLVETEPPEAKSEDEQSAETESAETDSPAAEAADDVPAEAATEDTPAAANAEATEAADDE